ncbi:hypothetical protein MAPG_04564 [Magnaporthiopsis poae ATCC 64411]|uniref:Major facilitator superfamily (MFS) profile domain-containing protein n=1 Tax=Magnaporthiopsis poae (strain ATCC 64411 / 73-15) TaxID=644358 RepID=A0A0C4DX26_MAGP6|nr:hypothetical protein MAPG_04564 [Magnaporthiopsis poae ATCC 64411]
MEAHKSASELDIPQDHGNGIDSDKTIESKREQDAPGSLSPNHEAGPQPGSSLHPSDYPDGGREAWMVLFGTACCLFCAFGPTNCIGVFQTYYVEGPLKAYGQSTVSWICSLQVCGMMAFGIAFGRMFDAYGARPLLIGGTLTSASPWTMRILAFIVLALLSVTIVTVKGRLPPQPKPLVMSEYLDSFKDPVYNLIVCGNFCFLWGTFLPYTFIILHAGHAGMDPNLAAYLLPIINAVSIFGRILPVLGHAAVLRHHHGRWWPLLYRREGHARREEPAKGSLMFELQGTCSPSAVSANVATSLAPFLASESNCAFPGLLPR